MKLYLVQHGEAAPEEVDPSRPLTARGMGDVERTARFAQGASIKVPEIWHSGKLRARQTAELLAAALRPREEIKEVSGLAPNDPMEPVVSQLETREEDLMIVGHLPFLAKLASTLLLGSLADLIAFRQGGIVCLERGEGRRWRLAWMITPDVIRKD
ncbi:MAG: phosphohistidine phosphatase SixA [candidate division NC10 bacterium]|nr:phosphohistidine phosphatase SixA [candidate division NC10 bacterium]